MNHDSSLQTSTVVSDGKYCNILKHSQHGLTVKVPFNLLTYNHEYQLFLCGAIPQGAQHVDTRHGSWAMITKMIVSRNREMVYQLVTVLLISGTLVSQSMFSKQFLNRKIAG